MLKIGVTEMIEVSFFYSNLTSILGQAVSCDV